MPRLAQYDYLFVFGLFFAFLDAFNVGANDVANS
jgi:sodium-dependent phosphate transporter